MLAHSLDPCLYILWHTEHCTAKETIPLWSVIGKGLKECSHDPRYKESKAIGLKGKWLVRGKSLLSSVIPCVDTSCPTEINLQKVGTFSFPLVKWGFCRSLPCISSAWARPDFRGMEDVSRDSRQLLVLRRLKAITFPFSISDGMSLPANRKWILRSLRG